MQDKHKHRLTRGALLTGGAFIFIWALFGFVLPTAIDIYKDNYSIINKLVASIFFLSVIYFIGWATERSDG